MLPAEHLESKRQDEVPRHQLEIDRAQLRSAWRIHADANWSFPPHEHEHWEFIYFVRGSGQIDVPHATLRPRAYNLVVYPPGMRHSEQSSNIDPEVTLCFVVEIPGETAVGERLVLPDRTGEMGWLCERIVAEFEAHRRSPLANCYTRALLHLVDREWRAGVPTRDDPVDRAVRYVHSSYSQPIDLTQLADVAHVSRSHLVHCFGARVGMSPLRYVRQVRIEAAKRLLAGGTLSVKEVARQVGFTDPLYFSRAFARHTGVSPTAFRRQANLALL